MKTNVPICFTDNYSLIQLPCRNCDQRLRLPKYLVQIRCKIIRLGAHLDASGAFLLEFILQLGNTRLQQQQPTITFVKHVVIKVQKNRLQCR